MSLRVGPRVVTRNRRWRSGAVAPVTARLNVLHLLHLLHLLRMVLLVVALGLVVPAFAGDEPGPAVPAAIPAASSDGHLWFVVPAEPRSRPGGRGSPDAPAEDYALCHYGRTVGGAHAETLARLPSEPERLAAWGPRVWLVFPARGDGAVREVFTIEARPHPLTGGYYAVPHDRLEVVQPLPGTGPLLAIAGTADGVVALVGGDPPTVTDAAGMATGRRLLRLGATGWEDLALPVEMQGGSGPAYVAVAGAAGRRLFLLADGAGGQVHLDVRDRDGIWTRSTPPIDINDTRSLVRAGGGVVVARESSGGRLDLSYLRPSGLLSLAEVDVGPEPWTVLGLADSVAIVGGDRLDTATLRLVAAPSGAVGPAVPFTPLPIDPLDRIRLPVLFSIAVFAIALIIFLRPSAPGAVHLPADTSIVPPGARLVTFAIDAAPGALLAMVVLRRGPGELLGLPLLTPTFDDSLPYLIMASLTMLHTTVTNLLGGRSLGKRVLDVRVVAVETGEAPSRRRMFLRDVVKTLIVMVPPLAVISLLSPNLQGLHDLAGRTVVVRKTRALAADD